MRDYEFYYTQDGSIGLYSYADEDVYHSKFGALSEAWEKFVIPSGIEKKFKKKNKIKVLDVCYGIGYNTKSLMTFAINFFLQNNIDSRDTNNSMSTEEELLEPIESNNVTSTEPHVHVDCLEINEELVKISPFLKTITKIGFLFAPKNRKEIQELLDLKFRGKYEQINSKYKIHKYVNYILIDALMDKYNTESIKKIIKDKKISRFINKPSIKYAQFKQKWGYNLSSRNILSAFLHNIYYGNVSIRDKKLEFDDIKKRFSLNFYIQDARKSIFEVSGEYDYMFLDAFTFSKAPELWTVEFIKELYNKLAPDGIIMTYSNSALVRNTFIQNGFYIGKIYNEKTGKYAGTIAAKDKSFIEHPLDNYELGLCATKAGIPYSDPTLTSTKEQILKRREIEFKTSNLMSSSKYMKVRKENTDEEI